MFCSYLGVFFCCSHFLSSLSLFSFFFISFLSSLSSWLIESCFHAMCELEPKKDVSRDSYHVAQLDTTENKTTHVCHLHETITEAQGLTVLLPHPLLTALANLSPTTGFIAGGVGTSLAARSAVGSNLSCVSTAHSLHRPSGRVAENDTAAGQLRRAPH